MNMVLQHIQVVVSLSLVVFVVYLLCCEVLICCVVCVCSWCWLHVTALLEKTKRDLGVVCFDLLVLRFGLFGVCVFRLVVCVSLFLASWIYLASDSCCPHLHHQHHHIHSKMYFVLINK